MQMHETTNAIRAVAEVMLGLILAGGQIPWQGDDGLIRPLQSASVECWKIRVLLHRSLHLANR
jgi:hypothetical protein